jgi:hypothetical protein
MEKQMKRENKTWGMLALALTFVLALVSCSSPAGGAGDDSPDIFNGRVGGEDVTITITKPGRAVAGGDNYVIYIGNKLIDSGTIAVVKGGLVTFKSILDPTGAEFPVKILREGGNAITIPSIPTELGKNYPPMIAVTGSLVQTQTIAVNAETYKEKFDGIKGQPGEYIFELEGDIKNFSVNVGGVSPGFHITLKGKGGVKNIQKGGSQNLFWINRGVILVLEDISLTLDNANSEPGDGTVVGINKEGLLEIKKGVTIKGNRDGVWLLGGAFVMSEDSKITGCPGVGVGMGGNETSIVTIKGGEISGNGSGIYTHDSITNAVNITMTGGIIKTHMHAGVRLKGPNSSFEKTGGIIYGRDVGDNSNKGGAIQVITANTLYLNTDASGDYAVKINNAGDGIASKSGNW